MWTQCKGVPDVVCGALAEDLDQDGGIDDVLPIPCFEGG